MWDGPRAGVGGAQSYFLPEGEAHPLSEASTLLHADLHSPSDDVRTADAGLDRRPNPV